MYRIRIEIRLQDLVEDGELGLFFGFERTRVVENFAVAIAQDIGREPAVHSQHARLQSRRDQRLHEGLAGLEILAADRNVAVSRQIQQRGNIGRQVRRAVGERHAGLQRGVSINLAGRDFGIVLAQTLLESLESLVTAAGLWNTSVDPHQIITRRSTLVFLLETRRCRPSAFAPCPLLFGACLTLGPLMPLHVCGIEDRLHRFDRLQRLFHLIQEIFLQNLRMNCAAS